MPEKRPKIILVHGYTGSPLDLARLERELADTFGPEAVTSVCLPGHDEEGAIPAFDRDLFVNTVSSAIGGFGGDDRELVLIGHSTGGTLLLSLLAHEGLQARLLVLAGTPHRITSMDLQRWHRHRQGKPEIPFSSIARMVSMINGIDERRMSTNIEVLVLHGLRDELVVPETPSCWTASHFPGPARQIMLPDAGHHLFEGDGGAVARKLVKEAISDALCETTAADQTALKAMAEVEPELERFISRSPWSSRHLAACPSTRSLLSLPLDSAAEVATEPVFANIEITTRCNLSCLHCARTWLSPKQKDMSVEEFQRILERLPHAYRITLVGLGEPSLHPSLVDFVSLAAKEGRRVGLVTNGMNLDDGLSEALISAGLRSIAFSIDAHEEGLASELRPGTDLKRIIKNVGSFVRKARERSDVSTAVFSALSTRNIDHLPDLIQLVAGLGVHVHMLTDLNFPENTEFSLWGSQGETAESCRHSVVQSVRIAFSKGLPVISVDGLEAFGLFRTYRDYLVLSPGRITKRSDSRRHCHSPWQTVPVNVDGDITLCDCQPEARLGNLTQETMSSLWNSPAMVVHRRAMLGPQPPAACRICPRF